MQEIWYHIHYNKQTYLVSNYCRVRNASTLSFYAIHSETDTGEPYLCVPEKCYLRHLLNKAALQQAKPKKKKKRHAYGCGYGPGPPKKPTNP